MPYLTPDSVPEGRDCRALFIPADSVWLALFGGALTELTLKWNWQKFGTLTVEETIAAVQAVLDEWYAGGCVTCSTPGGYRIVRIGDDGKLEELNDAGEWQPGTGDYYIPPPAAREGGTETDQICLAAKNAVNVLKQLYESLSESFADHLSEAEALTAFIAAAIALVGFEFAPITWAIAAFFLAVFETLYRVLAYVTADLWTEEFDAVLTCILVGCASNTDGVITFDNDCFNSAMEAQLDTGGLSEVELRLFTQVGYILYFIGGIDGLNLAGRTTEITNDDCDFCEPSCDMLITFDEDQPFEVIAWGSGTSGWDATLDNVIGNPVPSLKSAFGLDNVSNPGFGLAVEIDLLAPLGVGQVSFDYRFYRNDQDNLFTDVKLLDVDHVLISSQTEVPEDTQNEWHNLTVVVAGTDVRYVQIRAAGSGGLMIDGAAWIDNVCVNPP